LLTRLHAIGASPTDNIHGKGGIDAMLLQARKVCIPAEQVLAGPPLRTTLKVPCVNV